MVLGDCVLTGLFLLAPLHLHGETFENKQKIIQGHRDTCLSEKGVRQAQLLSERLRQERFTHVYTSDLQRAKQTCEIVMERNVSGRDVQITDDTRLRERKLGEFEGRPIDDCRQMMKSKSKQATFGMETKQQVRQHAVSFFTSLCHIILSRATSPSHDLQSRSTPDLETRSSHDLETGSASLKRKHVGSTSSLSEAEQVLVAEAASPPGTVSEEDSSWSSLSSDLAVRDNDLLLEESFLNSTPEHSGSLRTESHPDYSECNSNVLPGSGGWMMCRNLSVEAEDTLRRTVGHIGSSCNVNFERCDRSLAANVLVVSHGGFISQLLSHFVDELNCCLPGGTKTASTVTPNAGLSRFLVTISQNKNHTECDLVTVRCVAVHDINHLENDVGVEPLSTSEPL